LSSSKPPGNNPYPAAGDTAPGNNMKRPITILMITLVGLSACTETNLAPDRQEKGRQVLFTVSPVKTTDTRAVTTQSFSTSQTFGTTAFAIDAGTTWKAATEGSATIYETNITGKEISYQSGVWKADQSYYWEDFEDYSLTFLSWSPYDLVSTSSTTAGGPLTITADHDFSYTGWTMQNTAGYGYTKDDDGNYIRNTEDGSVDLLLAKSTDITEDTDGGRVLTQFVHQLCNVKINARIVDEPKSGEQWHIYKVALSGIYTKGNLLKAATINKSSSADDEPLYNTQIWGSQSDTLTYSYIKNIDLVHSEDMTEIFPQTLMLPQSVLKNSDHEPKVTIYYTDEKGAYKKLYGYLAPNSNSTLTAWLAGKSITYSINISTQEYYIDFDAAVDDWSDGSSTEISVGN
jgi:hypothetical protein